MNPRGAPRRAAESFVVLIAKGKYDLLAFAAMAAVALALTALVLFVGGKGERVASSVAEVEGYVAIVGLVLGLPALAYAMVTDSAVGRIESQLSRARRKEMEARLEARLQGFKQELPGHSMQVFLPDLHQTRLLPIYDPNDDGPEEGWSIERKTPQGLTGSAWVGRTYLWGVDDALRQPKLRLTADQLEEYADLIAVAAAPIFGKGGRNDPLGVLTVYSKSNDHLVGTDAFNVKHEEAAASLASIIAGYVPESGPLSQHDLSSEKRR